MRSIHKFQFQHLSQPLQVQCSRHAQVVLVDVQSGVPSVWIDDERDEGLATSRWDLMVFGTGHEIPKGAEHKGSFQSGPYVWHVYRLVV